MDIYYVEDNSGIAETVKEFLGKHGYLVSVFSTIEKAKQAFEKKRPTLVLIDWNMPDGSGNLLCRWIRLHWSDMPVIFLTVRGEARDMISGFGNGADDYVVKPFVPEVLLSRIGALLRRTGDVSGKYLSCGAVSLNREKRQVMYESEEIHLTPSEYQLLLCLLQNKGKIVTREKLLEEIWDCSGNFVNDNTLTVTMKRLRKKLHQPIYLKTVRSIGYCMEEIK